MDYTIPSQNINSAALARLFKKVQEIVKKKGGTIQITDMLSMLNFPPAVAKRISTARGPLIVSYAKGKYKATNSGKKIEENIPGSSGALGIIIHEHFSCEFTLDKLKKKLVIDKIKGLDADVPGPFNPDVDKIVIELPRHVKLEL